MNDIFLFKALEECTNQLFAFDGGVKGFIAQNYISFVDLFADKFVSELSKQSSIKPNILV